MSRSQRKTPFFGITTASSEKQDKRRWNRTFRRIAKLKTAKHNDAPVKIEAVTDVWDGAKDGKRYYKQFKDRDMRK
ncbi:hypothetical protein [Mucilaginibacter auburnensis]|uniref:Uncharacterized protein n=1 Tax=Mucilaginibacter auburnensis TaxID=1457233 RepID=A0A2H9VT85_9SPHI|nr:hypothetical protein [Mucilaginibacter auburnensis]PJJ84031.1 hypothetical protein CLV57_1030 [Mucilaginibacter auburnensis]